MAVIRLMYNCETDIDLIQQFSLYLDVCQIIEQDKDIDSLNCVSIGFTTITWLFDIDYTYYLYINNGYLHIMGINKCNTESGYSSLDKGLIAVMLCVNRKFASRCNYITSMFILFDC